MLDNETLRDVGRALPWLASNPQFGFDTTNVFQNIRSLDDSTEEIQRRYDSTHHVINQVQHKLAAALEELVPGDISDPEGEAAEALESAEAYFHTQRDDLGRLRNALTDGGATPHQNTFKALESLDRMYAELIVTMQEFRWTILITEGMRTMPGNRTFTSGADLMAALND